MHCTWNAPFVSEDNQVDGGSWIQQGGYRFIIEVEKVKIDAEATWAKREHCLKCSSNLEQILHENDGFGE